MKRHVSLAMVILFLLMAFSAGAELPMEVMISESINQIEVTDQIPNISPSTRVFRTTPAKALNYTAEDECTYQIRVNLEYDSEKYVPFGITLVNKEYRKTFDPSGDEDYFDIQAPCGRYDIVCNFLIKKNVDSPVPPESYVILENVDVTSDIEVTIDASTATNLIEFSSYNPDGNLSILPLMSKEECNPTVEMIYSCTFILSKNIGFIEGLSVYAEVTESSEYPDRLRNILVNDLSENYSITQSRVLSLKSSGVANVKMSTSEIKSCSIFNDPEDYFKIEASTVANQFFHTPSYPESETYWHIDFGNFTDTTWGAIGLLCPDLPDIYVDSPFESEAPLYNDMISIKCLENYYFDSSTGRTISQGLVSPWLIQKDGKLEYISEPYIGIRLYNNYQAGENCLWDGEFNPYVKTTFHFDETKFGASTPWAFFTNQEVDYSEMFGIDNRMLHGALISYIGKYGEVRDIDDATTITDIYYNGEKIRSFANFDSLMAWSFEWLMSGEELGELKFEITNENIEVEGLKGKNYIEACLDERNEECTIPTLQYVGFTDSNGKYTNTFENGKIDLFAGDFDIVMRNDWETTLKPAYYSVFSPLRSMQVEYAPYGSDKFTYMNVEMVPGAVWHPFGQYYTAEINDLAEGWYNVRITMEDEAGNWQKQTISPAFKILDTSSVEKIGDDPQSTPTYYNMQGVRIERPEKGIYLERSGNSTRKVVK